MGNNKFLVVGAAVLAALLLLAPTSLYASDYIMNIATDFVKSMEGFSSIAYWDVSRYSWGYGTQAPGVNATTTEERAARELSAYLKTDYNYLSALIDVPLNSNQWAALLSFSYNLGRGNADNLVSNINNQDWDALRVQWSKYVNAGGSYSDALAQRRNAELDLFFS